MPQTGWAPEPADRPNFAEIRELLNDVGSEPVSQNGVEIEEQDDVFPAVDGSSTRDLAAENAALRAKLESVTDTSFGILGGCYLFEPDKQSSILGTGAFGVVYKMINPHDS